MAGSGSGRKGGSRQSGGAVATRPSILERLDSAKARLNDKMALANDELRKANNALDRNTDASWTPRAQKQAERLRKAERRARSLVKGSRNLKRIALSADPARFGFARGSAQRSKMASDLRAARAQLRTLKARAAAADRTYRESPVVKYGLTSEVGGNRGQSRKAKQRASTRQTSIVDRAVGASMAVTAQRNEIKRLRAAARAQTARTNQSRR